MIAPAPVIVDAGPALNFFSINQERLLIDAIGKLATPEVVVREIKRKSAGDARLCAATAVLTKLEQARYLEVLSDDHTPDLEAAVLRISKVPMALRMKESRDLGEIMVIAHAAVAADRGVPVVVLIDDGRGRDLASLEAARLQRLLRQGRKVGTFSLMSTEDVLIRAAGRRYLPDQKAMRQIYSRLRKCDDGLIDIKHTQLLSAQTWAGA